MSDTQGHHYATFLNNQSLGDALGISDNEIKQIVHRFYSKVRDDAMLGPIFEKEMSEDWDHHLAKMCNFWTAVMFGKPTYKGNPLEVHSRVKEISAAHFTHWLDLFKQTLIEVCPDETHITAFYQRASNMARVMTAALSLTA